MLHHVTPPSLRVQVATPRVRTAAKAEIPHLDDHVSKLHAVGNMTQNKLQDINSAAIAVGVYNINVPYNTVTKGGLSTVPIVHEIRVINRVCVPVPGIQMEDLHQSVK